MAVDTRAQERELPGLSFYLAEIAADIMSVDLPEQ